MLINWRVIKSRSDTPMVRRVDTLQRIRDGERYRFSRRYPATSRPLFPRETEKEREKEMIESGANRIERFDTFSSSLSLSTILFPFPSFLVRRKEEEKIRIREIGDGKQRCIRDARNRKKTRCHISGSRYSRNNNGSPAPLSLSRGPIESLLR